MHIYRIQEPFIFTIFGASGDLAKLKLFPALYSLAEQKRLPKKFAIVGYARTKKTSAQLRKEFEQSVKESQKKKKEEVNTALLKELLQNVHYFTGQYDQLASFQEYQKFLSQLLGRTKTPVPHLAYFAVPPQMFEPIIQNLALSRTSKKEDIRLILEKPFGQDEKSATELYHFISRYFSQDQIWLLDHFLGKSGVQSILHLRQSNRILNLLLQGREIANIQITANENIGVENRVSYFEQVGIIKDMVQSHLLQILALTTMALPVTNNAASLHREKENVLSAISCTSSQVVVGQYEGYKKEPGVHKNSRTETFAALRLCIDQGNWYDTPIYIRTGKMLKKKQTQVIIEFKKYEFQSQEEAPNLLIIQISPEEKITIQLMNKYRSGQSQYETVTTSESIACSGDFCLPEHGLLLLDIIRQNRTSFLSFPEVLASWKVTEKILLSAARQKLVTYKSGSEGPKEQHDLLKKEHFFWHELPST